MPAEDASRAKIPPADTLAEEVDSVQSTPIDPVSAKVTPQSIPINSSSHSSVRSPSLSPSVKQAPSRRVSRARFASSLEQVMFDVRRHVRK